MFAGHALFAFAVAALVADWRGWDGRRALVVGVVAGAFAALPDVDIAYAFVGLAHWVTADGALAAHTAFWDASRATHRSVTHSLVVAPIAVSAFGLLAHARSKPRRTLALSGGLGLFAGLLALALAAGPLVGIVMALFLATGGLVAVATAQRTSLSAPTIALAALWGLWSHPWGDLFTGEPPTFLFPFDHSLVDARVVVSPDPTVHLLSAFAIELAAIGAAVLTIYRLTDREPLPAIDRRAIVGALYGVAALVATPPTVDVSYHFVFSILGVGVLIGAIRTVPVSPRHVRAGWSTTIRRPTSRRGIDAIAALRRTANRSRLAALTRRIADDALAGALTAIVAVAVALAAYTGSYLLVG